MRPLLLAALLCLRACGHKLTVVGADGTRGTGTATSGVGAGTVGLAMNGEVYRGQWTTVNSDALGAASVGTVLAQSDKGGRLRCRFTYGGFTFAGFGTCQDAAGRDYDIQIH